MRRAVLAAIFFLIWLPVERAPAAVTNCTAVDCVPRLPSVRYVNTHNLATDDYASFYLVSYGDPSTGAVTLQDGAAGLFVRGNAVGTAPCLSTSDNGGSVLIDGGGPGQTRHCFYRQNLSGDLRQWGLTPNSIYDVIFALKNGKPLVSATPIIESAITALTAAGITRLHTSQVSLKIDFDTNQSLPKLPAGGSLTCDAPPVKDATNADYTRLPGSLILSHGAYLDANTFSDIEIHHCGVIIPEWYINPSVATWDCPWDDSTCGISSGVLSPAQSYSDLEAFRANMITASDKAILAGNGAYIHDVAIAGFDNCIDIENAPHNLIKNVSLDCNIGIYEQGTNGQSTFKDIDIEPLLTKGVSLPNGTSVPNEEIFRVHTITASDHTVNGHPLCQLTLISVGNGDLPITASSTEPDPRDDPYYFPAWVSGPDLNNNSCASAGTGRNGNDAGWALIPRPDLGTGNDTYDLAGSQFSEFTPDLANAVHTNADWSTGTGNTAILRIAGPISNITQGMSVTSGDQNPAWPRCPSNCAAFTVQSIVARATGPDPDDGYNGEIVLSQPVGQAFTASGPIDVAFYSAHYDEPSPDTGKRCHNAASGGVQAAGDCLILNAAVRYVAGYSDAGMKSSARLPASRAGHMAAGILVDSVAGVRAINTQVYGHYYNTAVIDSGSCTFYQAAGDDNGELNAGNTVGFYVVGLSRGCLFVGKAPGKPGTAIVDDTFGVIDHSKAVSGQPVDVELGNSFTGIVTLPTGYDTSDWPTQGEMHICANLVPSGGCSVTPPAPPGQPDDEIVAYIKVPGSNNAFSIIGRARFSTAIVNWAGNAYLLWSEINNGSVRHEDKSASTIFSNLSENTTTNGTNQFEILHGAATLDNIHTSGRGTGFVSTNTSGVTVTAANLGDTSLVFEDGNAQILTTVSPDSQFYNFAPPGATNLPVTALNPGGLPLTADFSSLGTIGTGTISVSGNLNWPQNGVLVAGNEEMGFALPADGSTGELVITSRGECGTTPATHTGSISVQFIVTELPCGAAGLKGYASNGFTIGSPAGGDPGAGSLSTGKQIYENGGHPVPGVVCSSGIAHVAGTTETVLASCKIPGGVMGPNGCVVLDALWDWTNSGSSKTVKAYANTTASIGGTAYLTSTATNGSLSQRTTVKICNRNSFSSQIGGALSGTPSVSTNPLPTSLIDTASDWYVVFTGTKAASGDSLALEQYQVQNQPFAVSPAP